MTPVELDNYKHVKEVHTCNLDESCVMASEGRVKILGIKAKKKHEKNISDSRELIASVRVGSAVGVDGPCIYLVKEKDIELNAFKDFTKNFPAPPGSCVEMTPSAYTTDDAQKSEEGRASVSNCAGEFDQWMECWLLIVGLFYHWMDLAAT